MKRTKRYGGFLIGDKVQRKDGKFIKFQPALVIGFINGYIRTHWTMNDGTYFESVFAPNQLINLTRQQEDRTNGGTGTIPPKTKLVVLEDLPATPFEDKVIGNIQEARLKLAKLQDKELKAARDFVAETLRQTEIFLSPLSPCNDLPSPYQRPIFSTTNDFITL